MSNKIRAAYRRDKNRRPYRKMSDRIKPTSKGAFLQVGTMTEAKYENGQLVECVQWDMGERKVRKPKTKKAKKRRTILRRNTAVNQHAWGDRGRVHLMEG